MPDKITKDDMPALQTLRISVKELQAVMQETQKNVTVKRKNQEVAERMAAHREAFGTLVGEFNEIVRSKSYFEGNISLLMKESGKLESSKLDLSSNCAMAATFNIDYPNNSKLAPMELTIIDSQKQKRESKKINTIDSFNDFLLLLIEQYDPEYAAVVNAAEKALEEAETVATKQRAQLENEERTQQKALDNKFEQWQKQLELNQQERRLRLQQELQPKFTKPSHIIDRTIASQLEPWKRAADVQSSTQPGLSRDSNVNNDNVQQQKLEQQFEQEKKELMKECNQERGKQEQEFKQKWQELRQQQQQQIEPLKKAVEKAQLLTQITQTILGDDFNNNNNNNSSQFSISENRGTFFNTSAKQLLTSPANPFVSLYEKVSALLKEAQTLAAKGMMQDPETRKKIGNQLKGCVAEFNAILTSAPHVGNPITISLEDAGSAYTDQFTMKKGQKISAKYNEKYDESSNWTAIFLTLDGKERPVSNITKFKKILEGLKDNYVAASPNLNLNLY